LLILFGRLINCYLTSLQDKINKLNEDIFIENVWFNDDPYTVNVTTNNVGGIGLNITQIKLVNSSDTTVFAITNGGVIPKNTYSFQDTYVWVKKRSCRHLCYYSKGQNFYNTGGS